MIDYVERQRQDSQIASRLQAAGVQVSSVFDLVNSDRSSPAAIPVLVRSLEEVTDLWIKEGIVRALTTPEASGIANKPLLREFLKLADSAPGNPAVQGLQWAIGNALASISVTDDFPVLADILGDQRHGKAREMIALAVARTGVSAAKDVLCSSLADKVVGGHALMALNKIGATCEDQLLAPLEQDPRGWVRREARRMLRRQQGA